MVKIHLILIPFIALIFLGLSFNNAPRVSDVNRKYKTENIIVVVVDGARYSETWGDPTHRYIPHLANDLAKEGVYFSNFFNNGYTYTNSGHTAITTGYRQQIDNSGMEYPKRPSIFQFWRKESKKDSLAAWIITTKDKLEVLSNTKDIHWKDHYRPSTDCGVHGLGTGYRNDTVTFNHVKTILEKHHPNMVLINFKEPDNSGHANDWKGYLQGIKDTDEYIWKLYNFIQQDKAYKDKTALFVTNDHGRHLNSVKDGFVSHGDGCEGCRHISLFVWGPDFKKNVVCNSKYAQVDIPTTIAELMGFTIPKTEGKVITDLFSSR